MVDFNSENIEQKIQNLVDVGCTVNQILENPGVLRYVKKEIKKRVGKLIAAEQPVNVYSIVGTHAKSSKHFMKFSGLFQGKSWLEVLSVKLECSIPEVLQDVSPAMSYVLCSKYPDRTLEKIDILLGAGFTTSQIRGCVRVLNKDVKTLRRRVAEIHELGLEKLMTCSWLLQGEAKYLKIINNAKRHSLWGDKWEYVSTLLDLPKDEVRVHFKRIKMENVIPKIELLLKMGFTGQEILNRPRLMKISEKKIEQISELMVEHELHDLDVLQRYTWVVNRMPTLYHGVYSQKAILSKLLNCSKKTITKNANLLKQAFSHSDATILESISVLKSNGFSASDIEQCPLVLNHDPSVLRTYLDSLETRKELQPYVEWEKDKVKLLNVLQYFIEKDMNFSCPGCLDKKEHSEGISEADLLNEVD
jgi:DNA-binding transcriptional MerR regulator